MCGFRRPVARRTSRLDLDKWPNRMSPLGLGRVKTPTFNLRVEIPSRFRKFENQKCLRPPLREDDRENNSAHSWLVHVFTQPGSKADLGVRRRNVRFHLVVSTGRRNTLS